MIAKKRRLKKRVLTLSQRILYAFLGVLVLAIVGFLLSANFKINKKRSQLSEQINYLENQLRELEEQKAQYERGLMQVETSEFWEERLREQGYKKPGEEVFVVVSPEETESVQTPESKTFWQRLRERIGF